MENNTLTAIKAWITAAVAMLTAFWGWFGWLLIVWIGLMLADWLVGSAVAQVGDVEAGPQATVSTSALPSYYALCYIMKT